MSGKEELDREIPIPPEVEEWANITEMRHDVQTSEDQQELEDLSEKDISVDKSTPIENQIVGYNGALDQYALKSAGEITYVDSSELFQKVSNGEKVFVEGVEGSIPGSSIACQENDDMYIKEDMFVEHISVAEFKDKLDEIYQLTESPSQNDVIHDNIKERLDPPLLLRPQCGRRVS